MKKQTAKRFMPHFHLSVEDMIDLQSYEWWHHCDQKPAVESTRVFAALREISAMRQKRVKRS